MTRYPRQSSRQILLIAFLVVLAAAVAGCAGLGDLSRMAEPEVDVTDVKLLGTTLTGADLLFEFRVDNPNAVALVLDEIGYRLRLNGEPLIDGQRNEQTRIEASGRSVIELPVTLKFEDVYRVIRSFEGRDKPDYALDADFRFDVPILGSVTVPVTRTGEIPVDRLREALGRIGG